MSGAPGAGKEHSLTTSFSAQPLLSGGRTTGEGKGLAQYFSGGSPGPVEMVSRAVYTPDPLLQISLHTPCVCVSRTLLAEAGVPAAASVNPLLRRSAREWTLAPGVPYQVTQ